MTRQLCLQCLEPVDDAAREFCSEDCVQEYEEELDEIDVEDADLVNYDD